VLRRFEHINVFDILALFCDGFPSRTGVRSGVFAEDLYGIRHLSFLLLCLPCRFHRTAVQLLPHAPVIPAFALCVNELQLTIGFAAVRKSCSAVINKNNKVPEMRLSLHLDHLRRL